MPKLTLNNSACADRSTPATYSNSNKLYLFTRRKWLLFIIVFTILISTPVTTFAADTSLFIHSYYGMVMIGKNDPNDNSDNQHSLTLGGGPSGLWNIIGSNKKAFHIGRTHNQAISSSSSAYTGGRYMFFVDSNMHIGIDYWPDQIDTQNVKLDVFGQIRAEGMYYLSDRRYKRDVEPVSNLENLFKISSIQYKRSGEAFAERLEILKKSGTLSESDLAIAEASTKAIIEARNSDNTIHYGFIAQDLRKVYPNLVSEDQNGFLSVNYTELIPVLVDAIKELNNKIEVLESHDEKLLRNSAQSNTTSAVLDQNTPNPFDTQTEIKYYIPTVATNAIICVYDMVGAEVLKMEIRGRERGSITIDANQLRAGMYMYALLVDGKEVDVKRMILTGK